MAKSAKTGEAYRELWRAAEAWRESLPSDEQACTYLDPSAPGGNRPGVMKILKDSEYIDLSTIGPEAGESYVDPTAAACADRLEALRRKGFNVPQYAIDELRSEQP